LLGAHNPLPEENTSIQWELADLSNLSVEPACEFCSEYLATALWKRPGLHELLCELLGDGRETVLWAEVAAVLTAAKFCGRPRNLAWPRKVPQVIHYQQNYLFNCGTWVRMALGGICPGITDV
jgi:hypothetical protein